MLCLICILVYFILSFVVSPNLFLMKYIVDNTSGNSLSELVVISLNWFENAFLANKLNLLKYSFIILLKNVQS